MIEAIYETYLQRATELEARAATLPREQDREAMLKVAQDWRRMAQDAALRVGIDLDKASP